MLITIPDLLNAEQVRQCRQALESAAWTDGRATAGHVATHLKTNRQLALDDPLGRQVGDLIVQALRRHPVFQSAALPAHILPPRFNRYEGGEHYGFHIDNAIFRVPGHAPVDPASGQPRHAGAPAAPAAAQLRYAGSSGAPASGLLRTDISTTVFFSDPGEYEGGELIIQDTYGEQRVKLPAGQAVVYPGTSLHRVTPVTQGVRYGAFFWTQSLVRDDTQRAILLQQDIAIQRLIQSGADSDVVSQLTGVYHNLLRLWAQP